MRCSRISRLDRRCIMAKFLAKYLTPNRKTRHIAGVHSLRGKAASRR